MGRRNRRPKRDERQIADVKVAVELRPSPPLALVIDRDALAEQGLGFERRVGLRARLTGALASITCIARPSA